MIVEVILAALFTIYLINSLVRVIKSYIASNNKTGFLKSKRFRLVLHVIVIIAIPLIIIEFLPLSLTHSITEWPKVLGFIFSAAISILWIVYLRKLDIYEPEKWRYIAMVFVVSCITVWAVFPISAFINNAGFVLNGEPVNDFLYCVFSIGMVEELVKLLPVLIFISNKKMFNESYDYLFYASVSALGFAFIENILYINSSELYSVIGRLLMASVAHMTFSSTILYGVLLAKKRAGSIPKPIIYLVFFLLASLSHGFYDFWLINAWASQYQSITILFFLITIHIWFTMLNNALNISEFYNRATLLRVDKLKAYLIYSLLILFMAAVLVMHIVHGKQSAVQFFWGNLFAFGYFFIYIIYSHNRFKIVRGYMAPIDATANFFIPPLKRK